MVKNFVCPKFVPSLGSRSEEGPLSKIRTNKELRRFLRGRIHNLNSISVFNPFLIAFVNYYDDPTLRFLTAEGETPKCFTKDL